MAFFDFHFCLSCHAQTYFLNNFYIGINEVPLESYGSFQFSYEKFSFSFSVTLLEINWICRRSQYAIFCFLMKTNK